MKFSYHYLNYTAFVFIILKNFLVHLFQDQILDQNVIKENRGKNKTGIAVTLSTTVFKSPILTLRFSPPGIDMIQTTAFMKSPALCLHNRQGLRQVV
jgi:hypothetical protein